MKLNFDTKRIFRINNYEGKSNIKKYFHNFMEYFTIIIFTLGVFYASFYVVDHRLNPEKYFEYVPDAIVNDVQRFRIYGNEYSGDDFNTRSSPEWWGFGTKLVIIVLLWTAFIMFMRFTPKGKITKWWLV